MENVQSNSIKLKSILVRRRKYTSVAKRKLGIKTFSRANVSRAVSQVDRNGSKQRMARRINAVDEM
jgi:hypothetical protein